MKKLYALICGLFISGTQAQQMNLSNDLKGVDEPSIYGQWWEYNRMGGYDGFELRENGEARLLNWDSSIGKRWRIENNHLIIERLSRSGKLSVDDDIIVSRTSDKMILQATRLLPGESERKTEYIRIVNNNCSDLFLGHWDGEGDTYLQVTPINFFRFTIIVSENNADDIVRYDGELNEDKNRIDVEVDDEDEEVPLTYKKGKHEEEIKFRGRIFRRSLD